jgi:hypothetical protein
MSDLSGADHPFDFLDKLRGGRTFGLVDQNNAALQHGNSTNVLEPVKI